MYAIFECSFVFLCFGHKKVGPQVGKLVAACCWSAVYNTKPWQTVCIGFLHPSNYAVNKITHNFFQNFGQTSLAFHQITTIFSHKKHRWFVNKFWVSLGDHVNHHNIGLNMYV